MTVFEVLGDLVRQSTDNIGQSVVSIGRNGRGSGFVVAADRVLTNAHNLVDRSTSVRFADGRTAQASVRGTDVDGDLAVIEVDTRGTPALQWADEPAVAGDVVVAVTAGRQQLRATWGQVTSADRGFRGPRGRRIAGAFEHTAPSPSGSSGAPVVDRAGKVVGINTHRVDHGFYLARPADADLRERVAAMVEGRRYERARLGVALAPPHLAAKLRRSVGLPERDGLLVRSVVDDSPAAAAGVAEGDLLVRAGETDLATPDDLFAALAEIAPGDALPLTLVRGAEEHTVTVTWPRAD